MMFHVAIITLLGMIVPFADAAKLMVDFEQYSRGQVITNVGNNIQLAAYRKTSNTKTSLGQAMIFDSDRPTGDDFDLGSPNKKFGGPGIGKNGESGIYVNNVRLGKILIISEDNDAKDPDDNGKGGYFEFTFPEAFVIHRMGLVDNEEGIDIQACTGNNCQSRTTGISGDNGVQIFNFVDEDLGSFTKLTITFHGSGAVSFFEFEKASEVDMFPCILPTDTDKFSLITSGDAKNGVHSMYKGIAVGGLLSDESPNESGTVDRTMSFVQAMTAQSRFNFNGGIKTNQTVPNSMYEHFAFLTKNVIASQANGYRVFVRTTGGTVNLYDFVPGGQGEDNGKTIVFFNTRDKITISGTNDGRQFGPTIIAPFAEVYINANAGFVDGLVVAKNFATPPGCGSLQLHGDNFRGTLQCRNSAPVPVPVPVKAPTKAPTKLPTKAPTKLPTKAPTKLPTKTPTKRPTKAPTKAPTKRPTKAPTKTPTKAPTKRPTKAPTKTPTKRPTKAPTNAPTKAPVKVPTKQPTKAPTTAPTMAPVKVPTAAPVRGPATDGSVRDGDVVVPNNCMEDNWKASGKNMNLVCTAKEVSLATLTASFRDTCIIGQEITLSLNGTVKFNAERYDPAWFIAKDGGDALTGKCFIQPLLQRNLTSVDIYSDVTSTTKVGQIEWNKDFKGNNDACGDVKLNTGGGGYLKSVDIAKDLTLICDDKNRDGVLDVGICFSWREPGADDTCNVNMVYPGAPSKCFCTRYDIPQVTITTNTDPVDECY